MLFILTFLKRKIVLDAMGLIDELKNLAIVRDFRKKRGVRVLNQEYLIAIDTFEARHSPVLHKVWEGIIPMRPRLHLAHLSRYAHIAGLPDEREEVKEYTVREFLEAVGSVPGTNNYIFSGLRGQLPYSSFNSARLSIERWRRALRAGDMFELAECGAPAVETLRILQERYNLL